MEKLGHFLGVVDYLIIVGSLILCTIVGIFYKGKKSSSVNKNGSNVVEYFLGSRRMAVLPIAMSMLATAISAIPIVGGVGEIYAFGGEFAVTYFMIQFGKILAVYLIVPVFRYMDYVSIYQYLENRFDRKVRIGFAIIYMIFNTIHIAVALYLPSLLLATVTGFPYWVTSIISGFFCTVYCVMGGFKAVIWTDVIQLLFMFLSMTLMVCTGTIAAGGPSIVLREGIYEGFLKNLYWLDSPNKRFTVISSTIYGLFVGVQVCSTSQAVLQRLLSVKDIKSAHRAVWLTTLMGSLLVTSIMCLAAIVYTIFRRCDPLQQKELSGIANADLMLLYFMQKYLSPYPGFSGIVFAGILSGSLSTISSYINSFAAITLVDFIKPYFSNYNFTEKKDILISKSTTAVFGCLTILLSFVIPYFGGVIKLLTSIIGSFGGPMAGLMCLGIFVKRVKTRASLIGMLSGIIFCLWLTIGSKSVQQKYKRIPSSVDGCQQDFLENITYGLWNKTSLPEMTTTTLIPETTENTFPLYRLSFVWYGPIGFLLTVLVSSFASFLLKEKQTDVDVKLLSPLVTKNVVSLRPPCC